MWTLFTQWNNLMMTMLTLSFLAVACSEGILFKLIMMIYLTVHVGVCFNLLSSSYWATVIFFMNISGVAVLFCIFCTMSSMDNVKSYLFFLIFTSIPSVQAQLKIITDFYFGWIWSSSFLYLFLGVLLLLLMVTVCMVVFKIKCPFRPFL